MPSDQPLRTALLAKVNEQIERTNHLIALLPADTSQWEPAVHGARAVDRLLGHLLECLAGMCAALAAAEPERLAHFLALRDLPVNHSCSAEEAIRRIDTYRVHIDEGFALLTDADLARPIPTVFVKQGEPLLTLLLGNLEHLINHKHELFTCLKHMKVGVKSSDLYRFRT